MPVIPTSTGGPYNPNPVTAPSPNIRLIPKETPMFDGPAFARDPNGVSQAGNLTRSWTLFLEQWPGSSEPMPIVGFVINDGSTGTNVAAMLPAPFTGTADVIILLVKASDASIPLIFTINQNGAAIFTSPSIPAGTLRSTVAMVYTTLDTDPLPITYLDIFTIDITSGSSSWEFTTVLQTSTPADPGA